jgi:hypothetical protein
MVFGVADGDAKVELSPFRIYNDEITVLGSMAVLHSFGPALDLVTPARSTAARCSATTSRSTASPTRSRTCARAAA